MGAKKSILLPLIAVAGGAAGFGLRTWLFSSKDPGGLIQNNHPASWLLLILSAGILAALFLLTRKSGSGMKYYENFPQSRFSGTCSIIAAAGLFFAVLGSFMDRQGALANISNLLGILAVFSMGFTGFCRITRRRPNFLFHTVVCIFLAFYQLGRYRSWISNPQIAEYICELLACICLMLTAYYRAAFDANLGNRSALQFWGLSGTYFAMLSMAATGSRLFYGSLGLWAVTGLCLLDTPEHFSPSGEQTA